MTKPFKTGVVHNAVMGCWEVMAQVGGFSSKKEAERAAKTLAGMLAGRQGSFTEAITEGADA